MVPWQDEISLMAPWQGERQPCSTRRAQLAQIQSSQTWQGGQTRTCCTSNYHQMLLQKIVLWSQQKPWKRCGHVQRLNYNFEAFGNIFPAVLRFENKNLFWDFFIPNCLICPTIPNWWGSLPSFNELTHSFTEWAAHLTPMSCTAIYSSVFYLTAVFYLISILPHIYVFYLIALHFLLCKIKVRFGRELSKHEIQSYCDCLFLQSCFNSQQFYKNSSLLP